MTRRPSDKETAVPLDLLPVLLSLVAFGLRLGPLWVNRFHPDEALYASWALSIAYGQDTLLAQAAPDKPPLLFYLMAGAFFVLGRVEVAGRLVGLMAGTLNVPLMWRLAGGIRMPRYGKFATTTAMALSPFAILFSPTAFLDPPMLALALASLVAITHKRHGWAGLWLGLAVATKVQALVFLPLAIAYGVLVVRPSSRAAVLRRFASGLAIPLLLVLLWDRLRGGTPYWIQQTINYGGIRPIYTGEVMPRLIGWSSYLPYLLGWPMLIALAIGLPLLLVYDLARQARTASAALDLMLMAFTLGYFFLLWLLAFPVWDRYLLGLVPVTCLLVGRLVSRVASLPSPPTPLPQGEGSKHLSTEGKRGISITILVIILMMPSAVQAWQSALPVGGDHGTQDGIDQVTDYVRGFPYGTVVYDHWLGWSLRYYLWDARTYIAYFATPQTLAEDLRVFGRTSQRFIIVPSGESAARIERAIAAEGFALAPVLTTQNRHGQPTFTLYHIQGR